MQPYTYNLPDARIAQRPVHPPHYAKMLVVDRGARSISSHIFQDLPLFLRTEDLLLFNDSRVIPARFFGSFEDNGGEAEALLVHEESPTGHWRCIARPLRRFRPGRVIVFADGLRAEVIERAGEKEARLRFFSDGGGENFASVMERVGNMPIPPYIRGGHSDEADKTDYQTIFARKRGSIAAPTASLHFSHELMREIETRGVRSAFLTLHVGTASFLPLDRREGGSFQPPGEEELFVPHEVIDQLRVTKERGGRVIPVGTTAVRALETAMARGERDTSGVTDLFIQPGFAFKGTDAVITNFHQSGTTHLLLVEALLGRNLLEETYSFALEHGYRFLSYGDGMLIL